MFLRLSFQVKTNTKCLKGEEIKETLKNNLYRALLNDLQKLTRSSIYVLASSFSLLMKIASAIITLEPWMRAICYLRTFFASYRCFSIYYFVFLKAFCSVFKKRGINSYECQSCSSIFCFCQLFMIVVLIALRSN